MRIALLVLSLTACTFSQSPKGSAFEVASIKPSQAEEGHESWKSRLGNLDMRNVSLRNIILEAYKIRNYQLVGPDWLARERFDIVAKAPSAVKDEELPPLMQALLAERFRLVVHHEEKSMPAYALVVAKGAAKIHAVEAGPVSSSGKSGPDGVIHLTAKSLSMARLAEILFRNLDRPVVDKTGLEGVFDFKLDYAIERRPSFPVDGGEPKAPPDNLAAPSIFTALQEQLGLKLQADKTMVKILVVDSCEKVPTEN